MPVVREKFFVHIIESPSPEDLLDGQTEGVMLSAFLKLTGIPFLYNLVVDRERLLEALQNRITEGVEQFGAKPLIHISAHGGEDGIQLTGQREARACLPWSDLGRMLGPINRDFDGVTLCLSCCGGAHAKQMAEMLSANRLPMAWVVGTTKKPHYDDAALAFAVFYYLFRRGRPMDQIIKAMNTVSKEGGFAVHDAKKVQKEYSDAYWRRKIAKWKREHPQRPKSLG